MKFKAIAVAALSLAFGSLLVQCSTGTAPAPAPAQITCGQLKLGEFKRTTCDDGDTQVEVCTDKGLKVVQECEGGISRGEEPVSFIDLDYIDRYTFLDVTDPENVDDAGDFLYLITAHKFDEGLTDQTDTEAAIQKTINSISLERDLLKAEAIDPQKTIWRVNLDDLGINAAELAKIVAADQVKLVSNTTKGKLVRQAVGRDSVLFHFENFSDIVHQAPIYYDLLDVGNNINQLFAQTGVDFAGDLAGLDAQFGCFTGSRISAGQGDRMVGRFDADDGPFYITFDPLALGGDQTRNCFVNPLLAATGSKRVFNFAASEVIFSLSNGMQGYALFNNQGVLQNAAPINIVRDTDSPVDSEINNSVDCQRCHASSILAFNDQIREHVRSNASEFNAVDQQRIFELYVPNKGKGGWEETQKKDIKFFQDVLTKAGVDPKKTDPINEFRDPFKLEWDVERAAAFVLLTPDQLKEAINSSAVARQQVGQLLSGGRVSSDAFIAVIPQLKVDARLFEDPL
jgi:hypothetical protein